MSARPWLSRSVAVVGMAGRFPGAPSVDQLHASVAGKVEGIRRFTPAELAAAGVPPSVIEDPAHIPAGGVLDEIDAFDAKFFGFGAREAALMDPQDRLFMETAWHALEDAGCDPRRFGGPIGVFGGKGMSTYLFGIHPGRITVDFWQHYNAMLGNDKDYLATRLSYALGLSGPSFTVQTACSSSLVAVHLAVQSLLAGECDLALAGGVTIRVPQKMGYLFEEGGPFSRDGHCRPYDAGASGTVSSDGVAVVVLRRADDALAAGDRIDALIRGSAINNDGRAKVGFTAPSAEGQRRVIEEALAVAGLSAREISFIEGHGTGTLLGDAIELEALSRVFRAAGAAPRRCVLGSVKSNIGHTDAAAGVTGLIKTVLALKHRTIPPTLHFAEPNEILRPADSPLTVNAEPLAWAEQGALRRAGVSAFGLGGTNAHVVLEEGFAPPPPRERRESPRPRTILLSARSEGSLERATTALAEHLGRTEDGLDEIAFTTRSARPAFEHRRAVVARSHERAATALQERDPLESCAGSAHESRSLAFLFPGAGAQYPDMGLDLYRHEPVYRSAMDECFAIARERSPIPFRDLLYGPGARGDREAELERPAVSLPVTWMTAIALARLWISRAGAPRYMLGHSLGEYVAACLAGVLSLEDALTVTLHRAKLIDALPAGVMIRVEGPEEEVRAALVPGAEIAVANGDSSCIVSGRVDDVARFEASARERWDCQRIRVRAAGHSSVVEPAMDALRALVSKLHVSTTPKIPYLSNLTGDWIRPRDLESPDYWSQHLRRTVRLSDNIRHLLEKPGVLPVEIGPGNLLSKLIAASAAPDLRVPAIPSMRHYRDRRDDSLVFYRALAEAWTHGAHVDWEDSGPSPGRVRLPAYPFEKTRHWSQGAPRAWDTAPRPLDPPPAAYGAPGVTEEAPETGAAPPADPLEARIHAVWAEMLGVPRVGLDHDFFSLGGTSLLAVQMTGGLRRALDVHMEPRDLVEAPTLRRFVARMRERLGPPAEHGAAPVPAPLSQAGRSVALQIGPSEKAPRLHLLHPVGGHVFHYRSLVRHLGPAFSVSGWEAPGLLPSSTPLTDIGLLAEHHLGPILSEQPQGPYLLAGSSMGGMIVFEIARRLVDRGEDVAFVGLIDTPGPGHLPLGLDSEAEHCFYLFGELMQIPLDVEVLRGLDREELLPHVERQARQHGVDGFNREIAERLFRVFSAHIQATKRYDPAPLPGPVTFFRAAERRPWDPDHPERAWLSRAASIEIIHVPGDHITMMEEPHVQVLGAHLLDRLDAALRSPRRARAPGHRC